MSKACLWVFFLSLPFLAMATPASSSVQEELQHLYEKKEYSKVLEEVAKLDKETAGVPDVRRLKMRSLLKLDNPKQALEEYDKLESLLKREDRLSLREVALGFILVMLKDMREQMRGAAYTALKEVDSDDVVPYFEDGLSDGSGLVRLLAVEGLGRLETGRRSVRLRKAVGDPASLVKAATLKVLGITGDRSVISLLEQAQKDEQAIVRIAAAGALTRFGRSQSWAEITRAAGANNPEERAAALRVIGELGDSRGLHILLEAIGDSQPSVRGAAAAALGVLGSRDGVPALERSLHDPIPAIRTSAAVSLGELGDPASMTALKQALADAHPTVKAATVSALLRLQAPYGEVKAVIDGLIRQSDPGSRAAVAKALGRANGPNADDALDVLQFLLQDPLPRPRIAAARSLGHVGDQKVIPILMRALRDQDEAVCATAAGAIGRILSHGHRVHNHMKS